MKDFIQKLEGLPRFDVESVESSLGAYCTESPNPNGEYIKYSDILLILNQAKLELEIASVKHDVMCDAVYPYSSELNRGVSGQNPLALE